MDWARLDPVRTKLPCQGLNEAQRFLILLVFQGRIQCKLYMSLGRRARLDAKSGLPIVHGVAVVDCVTVF
jgi:hypothetical protein